MSDSVNQSQSQAQSLSTVLSARREALGLSQKQVADELFLTAGYISHIDEGEFDRLPNPAYIKGYLRSYARLVEIDGDRIVAAYEAEYDHPQEPELRDVSEEEVGSAVFTGPVLTTGLVGLGVTIVLVLVVWWLVGEDEATGHDFSQATETASLSVTQQEQPRVENDRADPLVNLETLLSERDRSGSLDNTTAEVPDNVVQGGGMTAEFPSLVAAEQQSLQSDIQDSRGDLDLSSDDVQMAGNAGLVNNVPLFSDVRIDRRVEAGVRYVDVTANGSDQLSIRFSGECWLRVSDADGRQLYADLNRGGDVLNVRGKGDFTILLGRGSVVGIEFNGDTIDVGPYIRDDETARIRTQDL
ncbi:MAG: hypothetical protein CMQ05_08405 [Gammaproteobacteria bacterium]|uniref:HTH cro/C1-type domain-containing protein n=1 Tax=OM182 bacterium MED-G24 TaxID=1986255 RepID=A0A2A5WRL9_9GAMM|nr:hypothetical protein [Gammaproteobacteria bacterium]PDH39195.1 MAG: hypothetical protein CNE99_06080 [OM182 bacterium MED-G24]RPG24384.1 MAG: helix-turn-helix domain-containing protein [Gammaproteobacteria bacterium TMED50]